MKIEKMLMQAATIKNYDTMHVPGVTILVCKPTGLVIICRMNVCKPTVICRHT